MCYESLPYEKRAILQSLEQNKSSLIRHLRKTGISLEDIEDLFSNFVLKLLVKKSLPEIKYPITWIYFCLRNQYSELKRSKLQTQKKVDLSVLSDKEDYLYSERIQGINISEDILSLIKGTPNIYHDVAYLDYQGYSDLEGCSILKIGRVTYRTRLYRLRQFIESALMRD